MKEAYDVIIIGGGPAGSSSAIRLRQAGLRVAVFEKDQFPRPHVGESLVPFCYPLFEELGILEELEQTTVRKPGVRFINKDGSYTTTYCFQNILKGPHHLSFHVLREKFDKQLLDKAKRDGAEVFENTKVLTVDLADPTQAAAVVEDPEGNQKNVRARFLIDATGQDSFLARKLNLKKKHKDLDRIAFLQHWDCSTDQEGIDEGLLQIVYLSSSKKGWIGFQPVDVNRLSVGIIFDNSYVKIARQKYVDQGISDWKQQFYLDEIQQSHHVKTLLSKSKPINRLMVVGDYSYKVEEKFKSNYAIIGDAAGFLDPVFATGVYLALNTSKNTSLAVIELLRDEKKGLEKLSTAYEQYEGALELLEKFIYNFYNPDFINLAEIGKAVNKQDESHTKHMIAFSILHFLMGGDFFNEYKRYSDFIEFLKSPKNLSRYLHLVIDNPDFQESNCNKTPGEIYPMLNLAK
ncbi:MAG: tryptophan 7-halogenase [Flavobacteriales bacterium]|nr:tryptophan 7-halogenase [Flavobacteriales bacterium]